MIFDLGVSSVLLAAFAPLIAVIFASIIDRRNWMRTEKPPQMEKLLRPPGHSLMIRLDETIDRTLQNILTACVLSGFAGASGVCIANFLGGHAPLVAILISALIGAAFTVAGVFVSLRAFRGIRQVRNIRLGLRGEQAVAESLSEVADAGFRSFHDLPGGADWNIDHVAVGTRGVFLIETKARRRRGTRIGQPNHIVIYDGETLRFPSGKLDSKAVGQVARNAKWLSGYLEKRTGERVEVNPVLVLPGWYVERKGNYLVKAMNATFLVKYLRGQHESIQDAQVRRLIAALDEKCRDVEF